MVRPRASQITFARSTKRRNQALEKKTYQNLCLFSAFFIIIEEQLGNGKEGKGNKEQKGAREEKQGIGRRTGDLRKRGRAKTGN